MVANLGCRIYVFLGVEMGADHGEDFWRYPNGDVERVHETFGVDEYIADPFLEFSSLETSKL